MSQVALASNPYHLSLGLWGVGNVSRVALFKYDNPNSQSHLENLSENLLTNPIWTPEQRRDAFSFLLQELTAVNMVFWSNVKAASLNSVSVAGVQRLRLDILSKLARELRGRTDSAVFGAEPDFDSSYMYSSITSIESRDIDVALYWQYEGEKKSLKYGRLVPRGGQENHQMDLGFGHVNIYNTDDYRNQLENLFSSQSSTNEDHTILVSKQEWGRKPSKALLINATMNLKKILKSMQENTKVYSDAKVDPQLLLEKTKEFEDDREYLSHLIHIRMALAEETLNCSAQVLRSNNTECSFTSPPPRLLESILALVLEDKESAAFELYQKMRQNLLGMLEQANRDDYPLGHIVGLLNSEANRSISDLSLLLRVQQELAKED